MPDLVIPSIEQPRPYEAGKPLEELARELGVTDAVKLASCGNPFGPSPKALAAGQAATADAPFYPDAAAYRLRAELASLHGVTLDEVLQGNDSSELLDLVVRTFCTPADHIVFAEPALAWCRIAAQAQGIPFSAIPLRDGAQDLPAMAKAVTPSTRVIFIAKPNSPTGTSVDRDSMVKLLREIPANILVVIDDAYSHYVDASDCLDWLQLREERERLVVLRTFSKAHGRAALRGGYAIAPAKVINCMMRLRQPFGGGSVAQENDRMIAPLKRVLL